MEVVIEISEDDYKVFVRQRCNDSTPICRLYKAIKNGTVLQNGHGDLKDMSNLKYVFDLTRTDYIYSGDDIRRAVESMSTIVPSDKEVSE